MTRITLNIISLVIFADVIVGADLALRHAGVDHFFAWMLGIAVGAIVMACLEISGLYSRSWRKAGPPRGE